MVDSVSTAGAAGNLAGLKRALKQEQAAKDLVLEAQQNLKDFNEKAGIVDEVDLDRPVKRGQIVDIIA